MTTLETTHTDEPTAARNVSPELGVAFGERLRSRDPEALERFFDLYFDSIYGRVRRLARSTQEAEDLTQDIFLNIHRSLPSFDTKKRLGPWVSAITMNRIRDHWRSRRADLGLDDDDDATASLSAGFGRPESELEQDERNGAVKRAVHRLPLDVHSVLCLRVYDGLAFKTIA